MWAWNQSPSIETRYLLKNLSDIVFKYKQYTVYTDILTGFDKVCKILILKQHLYSPYQKKFDGKRQSILRYMTENFEDNYPCFKEGCKIFQLHNWR